MADIQLTSQDVQRLMPLCGHLGVEIVSSSPDEVVGRLPWREELTTLGGALHGGTLMALADAVGGGCAFLNLPEGAGTSTISSSTVFLRGVRSGTVTATARPLHTGRSTVAVRTVLTDDLGRTVSETTQSQAVLSRA